MDIYCMLSIAQTNILWSLLNNFNQFINQTFNSYTNLEKVLIKMKNVINCTGCFMGTLTIPWVKTSKQEKVQLNGKSTKSVVQENDAEKTGGLLVTRFFLYRRSIVCGGFCSLQHGVKPIPLKIVVDIILVYTVFKLPFY